MVARASLPGFRLTFVHFDPQAKAGVCHLEAAPTEEAPGILWDEMGEPYTSRLFPGYKKVVIQVKKEDGSQQEAWTRVVEKPIGYLRPDRTYFDHVVKGAGESGFSQRYLKHLDELYTSLPSPARADT